MHGFLDEWDRACFTRDMGQGPLVFEIDTGFLLVPKLELGNEWERE